jgi:diguanylate cyclase (GGDEF)-like protein
MSSLPTRVESGPPRSCVLEVSNELPQETIARRWQHINTLLKLAMLTGVQMQMQSSLNVLCDYCAQIVSFDAAAFYVWDEAADRPRLRLVRGFEGAVELPGLHGNVLNFHAMATSKPLLVKAGDWPDAEPLMKIAGAESALAIPVLINERTVGSMQMFRRGSPAFTAEDAQMLWVLSRVTEKLLSREITNEGLLRFAFTDYLTGLKSRGYFEQQLELEIKRSERKEEPFALLMLDIDHFKQLNDRLGHSVGDGVLRQVGQVLMEGMREIDTVARYGGEEFAIILPDTTLEEAGIIAQRIRSSMEQRNFEVQGETLNDSISISIGMAMFGSDSFDKKQLIQFADAALYHAKSSGRNRVVFYNQMRREGERKAG